MMNHDDRLLAHKHSVDRERRAQAILRSQRQQRANAQMIERVAGSAR